MRLKKAFAIPFASLLFLTGMGPTVWAQGWILARQSAPGIGASGYLEEGRWEFNYGMRYQFSDKHFIGKKEQKERQEEGSQVENTIYLQDFGVTYGLSARTSISVSLPYLIAERTGPNRSFGNARYLQNVTGIGDLSVTARRWMLDPETHLDHNVQAGLGVKLPTGEPDALYSRKILNDDGSTGYETRTADQSVQPGDGGFGVSVDMSAFQNIGQFTPYFAGTYLINPRNTNSVPTFRSRENEAVMSVTDQYIARLGTLWTPAETSWSFGLGARIEGVPVHDLIGGEDGFRRPGYSLGVEPSVVHSWGHHSLSLSVPIAVVRNRQRSVQDLESGRHGDAAFADWALLFGWTYRF